LRTTAPPAVLVAAPRVNVLELSTQTVEARLQKPADVDGTALDVPTRQATLSPLGRVVITSTADLDILENGVVVGNTRSPQLMMPAGPHALRLVNGALGFERTQVVRVEPGKVARVAITLPESTIHLNARPWAEVWIDGTSVGRTPILGLPLRIGTHQIVFRHPTLGEKTVSTVVRVDAPTRVTIDLRQ
jgi:hypothetical protein